MVVQSHFVDDQRRGDDVARLVYEEIFVGAGGLGLSEDRARLVRFDESPEQQYAGIDIVVQGAAGSVSVEVKSAVDTAGPNKNTGESLQTFSQELAYVNARGEVKDGWLVDPSKQTDVFAFCWIPKVNEELEYEEGRNYFRIRSIDDIKQLDVSMIERKKLIEILLSEFACECSDPTVEQMNAWLKQEAVRMTAAGTRGKAKMGAFPIWLSRNLGESPVNVLVPKRRIEQKSFRRYRLLRDNAPSRYEWGVEKLPCSRA